MAAGRQRNANLTPVTGHTDSTPVPVRAEQVTAILVDGGFYRRRAARLFGHKEPEQRADELLAAQQEGRRHAAAASAAAQEKDLVQQALSRLQAEVSQQVQAKSELCALLEKVQQMQCQPIT